MLTPSSRLLIYSDRIEQILLVALVISLPLRVGVSSVVIGSIVLYWILTRKFYKTFEVVKGSLPLKLLLTYFFVLVCSSLLSANMTGGILLLEKRLTLLAVPLTLASFSVISKEKSNLLRLYIAVCLCCAIYSLISTYFLNNFDIRRLLNDEEYLSYYSWILHQSLDLNSSYYALFIAFASILSAHYALISEKGKQIYFVVAYFFFFFFLALLGSRISLASMVALSLLILAKATYDKRIKFAVVVSILSLLLVSAFLFLQIPYLNSRVRIALTQFNNDPRHMTFDCALNAIRGKPIFGQGLGDVEEYALSCYLAKGYTEPYRERYNFHNEFLEVTASSGTIGLLIFVALILSLFNGAWRQRNIVSISFLILIVIACQTESLLSRNKGILFFALFSTLLIILDESKEDPAR